MASHRSSGTRPGPVTGGVVVLVALAALAAVALLATGGGSTPTPVPVAAPATAPASPPTPAGIADRAACPPDVVACVDLRTRQSWLQRDGNVVFGPVPFLPGDETGRVAPGPTSSATPTGLFHVGRKKADEVSGEYGEPMPHAVFFAPGGIAFHQGSLDGSSHGCVHLDAAAATAYFDGLRRGDAVLVFS